MIERLDVSARAATLADLGTLQALARAQASEWHARDARLPQVISVPRWIVWPDGGLCWLASERGRPVAALTMHEEGWPEDSPFANVFPRDYLRLRFTLARGEDPSRALAATLAQAERWPDSARLEGQMLQAPVCDDALAAALRAEDFSPYHTIAYRPMFPLPHACAPNGLTVRLAEYEDVNAVAAIMEESWRFHAAHQPAIEITRRVREQCEYQTRLLIADGYSGALLVAEAGGEIVGFFGIAVNYQDPASRPALFRRGRYGDILEVAVRSDQRRGGVGSAMFRAAWQWFAGQRTEAIFVNYAPTNPISSRFWPKMGFEDAWTSWWRGV